MLIHESAIRQQRTGRQRSRRRFGERRDIDVPGLSHLIDPASRFRHSQAKCNHVARLQRSHRLRLRHIEFHRHRLHVSRDRIMCDHRLSPLRIDLPQNARPLKRAHLFRLANRRLRRTMTGGNQDRGKQREKMGAHPFAMK